MLAGGIAGSLRSLASRGVEAVIEPGKIGYLFGEASGSEHNVARAAQNALQMKRLGASVSDVIEHLSGVVNNASNVARTFTNKWGTFEVRESLFAGRSGQFAKFESTWEVLQNNARRLITVIPFGGN